MFSVWGQKWISLFEQHNVLLSDWQAMTVHLCTYQSHFMREYTETISIGAKMLIVRTNYKKNDPRIECFPLSRNHTGPNRLLSDIHKWFRLPYRYTRIEFLPLFAVPTDYDVIPATLIAATLPGLSALDPQITPKIDRPEVLRGSKSADRNCQNLDELSALNGISN